jgi:hypothetical protein
MIPHMAATDGDVPVRDCVRDLVDAHFARRISPARERRMRLHLPHCASCRRYYEKHLVLASLDPRAPSAEQRLAAGLGLDTVESAPRSRAWALAAAMAAVAVVFLLGRASLHPGVLPGTFSPRGPVGPALPQLFVYRLQPVEQLAPGATVHRGEDLAFAYANPSAFGRLLVFGVDEHKHVYWYYPAWSNAADDPRAVAIASGAPDLRELPEAIRHDLDGDRLVLYAEFSNDDIDVRAVEDRVAAAPPGAALELPGAYEQRTSLTLER